MTLRPLAAALVLSALPALAAAQQQAQQPPEPSTMSRQQLREEVTRLRGLVQGRAVLPQRPAGCVSPESRQFDFWIGEWDVSPSGSTTGATVAESSITSRDQGCVIMEEWRPFGGGHGHSINNYDADAQRWHQTWVDSTGRRTEYAGTFENGVMYLDDVAGTGPGATPGQRARMNYQALDANTVRQWGETLDPATNTWTVTWDLTYRRRAGTR
ncbi:MAG: hypothetical protein R3C25_05575 [Hyphomonadaceae bacterium]